MGEQPALGWLRVVRRDHQQPVCAFGRAGLGQADAVSGVIGARAGDDARPVANRLQHHPQQLEFLVVGGGRRLAGGSRDDQTVAPRIDKVVGQLAPRRRCPVSHRGQTASPSRSAGFPGARGRRIRRWSRFSRLPGPANPFWHRRERACCPATRRAALGAPPACGEHLRTLASGGPQASVANGLVATSVPSARVDTSKSANTAGATSASCRRHSMARRRISTSACSLARIAMKCRHAR